MKSNTFIKFNWRRYFCPKETCKTNYLKRVLDILLYSYLFKIIRCYSIAKSIMLNESLINLLFDFNKALRIRVVWSINNLILKFVAIHSAWNSLANKILTAIARGWHYDKVYNVEIVRASKGRQNPSVWLTNLLFTLDFKRYF